MFNPIAPGVALEHPCVLFYFFRGWSCANNCFFSVFLYSVGYILSAVFVCLEYYSLGLNYPEHRILKISFILKAIFIVVEFTLAVAFASESRNGNRDVAGVLEWSMLSLSDESIGMANTDKFFSAIAVSFIYGLYIFSYVPDLLPAVRFRKHVPQGERYKEEMRQAFAGDTNPNRSSYASQLPQSRGSDRSQYEMAENRNGQPASPTYPPEAHAQV